MFYTIAIKCPHLEAPTYGKVVMKGNTHGYKAYYSCNHGYKLLGDAYITCDYGKWIGIIPTCKRMTLQVIKYTCIINYM